jgi:hypothetical protein
MRTRSTPAALVAAVLLTAVALGGCAAVATASGPTAVGAGRLGPRGVADVVALLHHDQQGIVLAHQAAAQSPSAATRNHADGLADRFQRQAAALTGVLDASRVPMRQRLVDTTRLAVTDATAVGCDLMPDDAVSQLAATPPAAFDARFSTLMRRHLVGGIRMAASVVANDALDGPSRTTIQRAQEHLS